MIHHKRHSAPRKPSPDGYKSNAERHYAHVLELQRRANELQAWKHEAVTLVVIQPDAKTKRRYTPDFYVLENDGSVTFIEVKGGFIREDAQLKFERAAEAYPAFRFVMVQYVKGTLSTILEYNAIKPNEQRGLT